MAWKSLKRANECEILTVISEFFSFQILENYVLRDLLLDIFEC